MCVAADDAAHCTAPVLLFSFAVFTPPSGNNTLQRLALAIPDLTSLPTLVLPRLQKPVMPTVTVTLPEVSRA
jgi:hypothetical protein